MLTNVQKPNSDIKQVCYWLRGIKKLSAAKINWQTSSPKGISKCNKPSVDLNKLQFNSLFIR